MLDDILNEVRRMREADRFYEDERRRCDASQMHKERQAPASPTRTVKPSPEFTAVTALAQEFHVWTKLHQVQPPTVEADRYNNVKTGFWFLAKEERRLQRVQYGAWTLLRIRHRMAYQRMEIVYRSEELERHGHYYELDYLELRGDGTLWTTAANLDRRDGSYGRWEEDPKGSTGYGPTSCEPFTPMRCGILRLPDIMDRIRARIKTLIHESTVEV